MCSRYALLFCSWTGLIQGRDESVRRLIDGLDGKLYFWRACQVMNPVTTLTPFLWVLNKKARLCTASAIIPENADCHLIDLKGKVCARKPWKLLTGPVERGGLRS